nr:hypothetical protein [Tanacetum cinerariifolium]
MFKSRSYDFHEHHLEFYNALMSFMAIDEMDQEGEKKKRKRKNAGESSSKKDKAPIESSNYETYVDVDEPQEQEAFIIGMNLANGSTKEALGSSQIMRSDGKDYEFRESDYPRSVVIKKRVEYAYMGVESYRGKLNLEKPRLFADDIQYKLPYTTNGTSKGVVYLNKNGQKMLMRYDEVHKFSDGTLNKVSEKINMMIRGYGKASS